VLVSGSTPSFISLISPRNPRSPGVVRDKRLCPGKSPMERWSNGVLEYCKQICLALVLCWLGKQYLLFHNRQIDLFAGENVQIFQGCKMFRCFFVLAFPLLHHSINALSLKAYEPPMGADQSPVLWAGIFCWRKALFPITHCFFKKLIPYPL